MKKKLRVLGVDPGTRVAGYGVLDVVPGRPPLHVASGPIALPTDEEIPVRLGLLYEFLLGLVREHSPDALAVETIFHGKSFQSVVKVGEARGVVLLLANQAGLEICEYSPALIKKAATGNGRATKAQVQRMITRILELEAPPQPVDVSDALAIAFCYCQRLWRRDLEPGRSARVVSSRASREAKRRRWEALVRQAEKRAAAARKGSPESR